MSDLKPTINTLLTALQIPYALVWLYTGTVHATSLPRFVNDVSAYRILPVEYAILVAPVLVVLHCIVGAKILLEDRAVVALTISLFLLVVYTIAVSTVLIRGDSISCGCFGTYSSIVSPIHVAGNLCLLLLGGTFLGRQILKPVRKNDGAE
jgi:putative oxidoreductase